MKKQELIDKLLYQDNWEETYKHFAEIGMQKSTKKELQKWILEEEHEDEEQAIYEEDDQ